MPEVKLPRDLRSGDYPGIVVNGMPHVVGPLTRKLQTAASLLLKSSRRWRSDGKWFTFEVDEATAQDVVSICDAGAADLIDLWFDRGLCRVMVREDFFTIVHGPGQKPWRKSVTTDHLFTILHLYPVLYEDRHFITGEYIPVDVIQRLRRSGSFSRVFAYLLERHGFDPDVVRMLFVICYLRWKQKLEPFDYLTRDFLTSSIPTLEYPTQNAVIFAVVLRRALREFNLERAFEIAFPDFSARLKQILK